jgi:periplasmic divalent cation tolerance protein
LSSNFIIVLVTTSDQVEAEKIVHALLTEKLIACANIINPVTSFFQWKGKLDCSQECLVVMKSNLDLFATLTKKVKEMHSYEVPEILALPIIGGSETYMSWMSSALAQ